MRELHEEGRRRTNSELHLCQEELAVALGTEASKKVAARLSDSSSQRRVLALCGPRMPENLHDSNESSQKET